MNDQAEPQWAPGAADYLASILEGDEVGFEWGGGASSLWLAPQIAELKVMETSANWANKILSAEVDGLINLWVRNYNDPDYVHRARECQPRPNLWLIDGFRRIDCIKLIERDAREGDLVVLDDALDYAEHLLDKVEHGRIERFSMPHPHAGKPCVSRKSKLERNTKRKTAPATKETWIWRV